MDMDYLKLDPKNKEFKNMNHLVCGFTAPNVTCGSQSVVPIRLPKLKIANIVLRWRIPTETNANNSPCISPVFSVGEECFHTNWRIHLFTNQGEGETKMISVFIEFYEHLDPTQKGRPINAIYIVRLVDWEGCVLQSKRSGIRNFQGEKLSYGWKSYCQLSDSLENLLESNQLTVEVDLSVLRCEPAILVENENSFTTDSEVSNDELKGMNSAIDKLSKDPSEEEENIQWVDIMLGDQIIRGNKAKLIKNSEYFAARLNMSDQSQKSLTLRISKDLALLDAVNFMNGDIEKCSLLHSDNFSDIQFLWTRGISFKIPNLMYACFNAMAKVLPNLDSAICMAMWSKVYNLDWIIECEAGMALLSSFLLRHVFEFETSSRMQDYKDEYGDWIMELLVRAK